MNSNPVAVLKTGDFKHYIDEFNKNDNELYIQAIPNSGAWDFIKDNVPLLDCPDKEIEEIYYFRWWTYRKHIKETPEGYVITEFLPPVGWAGKYNTINCPAGHHFREGRWLSDPKYLNDYSLFWFRKGGSLRKYSFWAAASIWARCQVTGDERLAQELLPDLIANYEAWEAERRDSNGLFWQIDDLDGMEVSIGGSGYRATINSYMYGDAMAIADIAESIGKPDVAHEYREKAARLKHLVQEQLWDGSAQFFKVAPRIDSTSPETLQLCGVRELHGLTPWYVNMPDADKSVAWNQLLDPQGFHAAFGPTTAEQRHPAFAIAYHGHECQWNGPSWPFATSITLTAMANLLNNYEQNVVSPKDYFDLLKIYTKSHHRTLEDGQVIPWIDENLNPTTGDWISRTMLKHWKNGTWDPEKGGEERGKDYNHSTYCDIVISGLIGLRPRANDIVEIHPLVPETWDHFCLDRIRCHGRWLTILYDKTGHTYNRGIGLQILADGTLIASTPQLAQLTGKLS